MIHKFLQEEMILSGSINDIIEFKYLYNKYCEWQYMQDYNCILTPKPNFKNILKNYPEISFHSVQWKLK